jgi:carbon-monoxide dehydrogenase large subunit
VPLRNRDGFSFFIAPHPVLALDAVRFVGEPVAVVVAETLSEAMEAAERVAVVYQPLAAVARPRDALLPGAPLVWEQHGSNLCVDSEVGDKEATDAAFARAAYVVRLDTTINRVIGVPMELRAAIGVYDDTAAQFTVYTSAGGGVVRQRDDIASALEVTKETVA